MRKWILSWIEEYGGVDSYINQKAVPLLNKEILISILNNDIKQGLQRERLWFAIILLFEWYEKYTKKVSGIEV